MESLEAVQWPLFIGGAAASLFGWTLYWLGTQVIGTFLGASLGTGIGLTGATMFNLPDETAMMVIGSGAALGGLTGWWLIRTVQFYFFFIVGALLAGPLTYGILNSPDLAEAAWTREPAARVMTVIGGALAGGGIMVLGKRYVISIVTALIGASMIAASIPMKNPQYIGVPVFLLAAGIQIGLVRFWGPNKRKDDK